MILLPRMRELVLPGMRSRRARTLVSEAADPMLTSAPAIPGRATSAAGHGLA
jgi:hypothetical protein